MSIKFTRPVLEMEVFQEKHTKQHKVGLIDLLQAFRHRSATNPRNKVFALLGLANFEKSTLPPLLADYSLSSMEAFTRATRHVIQQTSSLCVLFQRKRHKRQSDFPSWVPDWSKSLGRVTSWHNLHVQLNTFYDAAKEPPAILHPAEDSVLTLDGIHVDSITSVSEPMSDMTEWLQPAQYMERMHRSLLDWRNSAKSNSFIAEHY
jgi:hypothetical protein